MFPVKQNLCRTLSIVSRDFSGKALSFTERDPQAARSQQHVINDAHIDSHGI